MANKKILVIDDDPEIQAIAEEALTPEGFHVSAGLTAEEGLRSVSSSPPHLILLDLMLPDMSGLDVCRELKARPEYRHVPVVMLSAKNNDADIVSGLEIGAEDYITKPFSTRVLVARIRTVLRRQGHVSMESDKPTDLHDIVIHPGRHEVLYNNTTISLTPTEFKILHLLASRPGWVFTRYQIVDAIRGEDFAVSDRSVDVQISSVRRKMGKAGRYIETVRGIGYRFTD